MSQGPCFRISSGSPAVRVRYVSFGREIPAKWLNMNLAPWLIALLTFTRFKTFRYVKHLNHYWDSYTVPSWQYSQVLQVQGVGYFATVCANGILVPFNS